MTQLSSIVFETGMGIEIRSSGKVARSVGMETRSLGNEIRSLGMGTRSLGNEIRSSGIGIRSIGSGIEMVFDSRNIIFDQNVERDTS